MIDITLKKKQGNFKIDTAFIVEGNGTTALFGHSGAGKTSVINMIAGLSCPDSGHIIINGRTVFNSREKINLPPEKRRFGYVFQEGRLFPHLSVNSNLLYGMKRIPENERFIHLDQVIGLLGIGHLLKRRPGTLSGGEKQRVAIGRSLLTSPALLLMDEPLASLDAARKKEVLPFIASLSKKLSIPILYVSHALNEIISLSDHLVFLSNGKVQASGNTADVVCQKDFNKLSGRNESGTMLITQVTAHDPAARLTKLSFLGKTLIIPQTDLPVGHRVRVWIRWRDVGLSLEKISKSSFQNILSGTVTALTTDTEHSTVNITMDVGFLLTATITHHAACQLRLKPGMEIHALIKSISLSFDNGFLKRSSKPLPG